MGCSSLGMNDLPTPALNPVLNPSSCGGGVANASLAGAVERAGAGGLAG